MTATGLDSVEFPFNQTKQGSGKHYCKMKVAALSDILNAGLLVIMQYFYII